MFREAVRDVLATETDILVSSDVRDGLQAVGEAERVRPDVAILDAKLPRCDGIRATALILERVPECRTLILAEEGDDSALVESFENGASGFLTKGCALSELIDAVRAVARGETVVPPRLLGRLLSELIRRRREQDEALKRASRLTRREREVLALLADGADNTAIARSLVISPQTARTHIQNVIGKLGVHSRLEAAMFVTQHGVLQNLLEGQGVRELHLVPG